MARLAVTVTVLFFLFAFSYSSTQSDLPENDDIHRDLSNYLPESDSKATILLPSEKPESEPTTILELEPEVTDTNTQPIESAEDLPASDTDAVDAVPLTRSVTVDSFRPVNRHFHLKRQFPFRITHRGCRHHVKPTNPEREVSYGNDMILSGENSDFDPVMFHHHHHHHHEGMPRFPQRHNDMFAKHNFKRPFRHEEEEEKKGREGFMMKRIRKFLNHF